MESRLSELHGSIMGSRALKTHWEKQSWTRTTLENSGPNGKQERGPSMRVSCLGSSGKKTSLKGKNQEP